MPEITDSTGSSISGPMTRARETNGCSGKVTTAIARDKGEFLARVVMFSATMSFLGNFIILPTSWATKNSTAKKISRVPWSEGFWDLAFCA